MFWHLLIPSCAGPHDRSWIAVFSAMRVTLQPCKKATKHLSVREPEPVLVNALTLHQGLMDMLHSYPETLSIEEKRALGRNRDLRSIRIAIPDEDECEPSGEFMLGDGKLVAVEQMPVVTLLFQQYLSEYPTDMWSAEDLSTANSSCVSYARFALRGMEIVHSASYLRQKTRHSFYCLLRVDGGYFIARIESLFKLRKTVGQQAAVNILRLAKCSLYKAEKAVSSTGECFEVEANKVPDHTSFAVPLSCFDFKGPFLRSQPWATN